MRKIAPYRARIYHSQNGNHLSHFEQPSYKNARVYVREGRTLLYITFPFYDEDTIDTEWGKYIELRKEQLEAAYFNTGN